MLLSQVRPELTISCQIYTRANWMKWTGEVWLMEPLERMGRETKETVKTDQYYNRRRIGKRKKEERKRGMPRRQGHERSPTLVQAASWFITYKRF